MTTEPDDSTSTDPSGDAGEQTSTENPPDDAGAEMGITEGEGSTFEPEEDAEGHV
jgi:hypothetical protein